MSSNTDRGALSAARAEIRLLVFPAPPLVLSARCRRREAGNADVRKRYLWQFLPLDQLLQAERGCRLCQLARS